MKYKLKERKKWKLEKEREEEEGKEGTEKGKKGNHFPITGGRFYMLRCYSILCNNIVHTEISGKLCTLLPNIFFPRVGCSLI